MTETGRMAALRHLGFRRYWLALILSNFAIQMQTVAVGWQVYDLTRNPLDLGLVGLSQFLPALLLVLVTGAVADRFSRRRIMGIALFAMALCSGMLFGLTSVANTSALPIFASLAVFGAARAFFNPARQALVSNLVPPSVLSSAVAINTTTGQIATICGPVAGGLLYGLSPLAAYGATLGCLSLAGMYILLIPKLDQRTSKTPPSLQSLLGGFRYIWKEKIVLGAISLDLFAVLLGGAVALLPVYARDILDVGPMGLGFLRSAMAIGAITIGLLLVLRPIRDHAGHVMFAAVAVFGLAAVVFAFSTTLWLSVLMLAVMGAADMVSVNIRATLIQLWTPDDLRGRVNAVNQVFIGASNEVGGFRAGTTAALMGPVAAVAVGGVGTLAVVALWMRWFPDLRKIRELDGH